MRLPSRRAAASEPLVPPNSPSKVQRVEPLVRVRSSLMGAASEKSQSGGAGVVLSELSFSAHGLSTKTAIASIPVSAAQPTTGDHDFSSPLSVPAQDQQQQQQQQGLTQQEIAFVSRKLELLSEIQLEENERRHFMCSSGAGSLTNDEAMRTLFPTTQEEAEERGGVTLLHCRKKTKAFPASIVAALAAPPASRVKQVVPAHFPESIREEVRTFERLLRSGSVRITAPAMADPSVACRLKGYDARGERLDGALSSSKQEEDDDDDDTSEQENQEHREGADNENEDSLLRGLTAEEKLEYLRRQQEEEEWEKLAKRGAEVSQGGLSGVGKGESVAQQIDEVLPPPGGHTRRMKVLHRFSPAPNAKWVESDAGPFPRPQSRSAKVVEEETQAMEQKAPEPLNCLIARATPGYPLQPSPLLCLHGRPNSALDRFRTTAPEEPHAPAQPSVGTSATPDPRESHINHVPRPGSSSVSGRLRKPPLMEAREMMRRGESRPGSSLGSSKKTMTEDDKGKRPSTQEEAPQIISAPTSAPGSQQQQIINRRPFGGQPNNSAFNQSRKKLGNTFGYRFPVPRDRTLVEVNSTRISEANKEALLFTSLVNERDFENHTHEEEDENDQKRFGSLFPERSDQAKVRPLSTSSCRDVAPTAANKAAKAASAKLWSASIKLDINTSSRSTLGVENGIEAKGQGTLPSSQTQQRATPSSRNTSSGTLRRGWTTSGQRKRKDDAEPLAVDSRR